MNIHKHIYKNAHMYKNILDAQSHITCSCIYICTHKHISHIPNVHTQIYTYKPHKHTYMTKQHTTQDHMIHRNTHIK